MCYQSVSPTGVMHNMKATCQNVQVALAVSLCKASPSGDTFRLPLDLHCFTLEW